MTQAVRVAANAGPAVGLGHLVRCSVLVEALREEGVEASLCAPRQARTDDVEAVVDADVVWREGLHPSKPPDLADLAGDVDGLVVDHYHALKPPHTDRPDHLAVIDDLADRPIPCDILVNPNAYGPSLETRYEDLTDGARLLLGSDYTLLRPPLRDPPAKGPPSDSPVRVLLTVGGADPNQLLEPLARKLHASARIDHLHVIAPAYLDKRLPDAGVTVHAGLDARQLADLMARADLAVSAGGQTLHELASAGVPTAAVQTGHDQARNIDAMASRGVVERVSEVDETDVVPRVVEAVEDLARDPGKRASMAKRGRSLVDGHGARRVAESLTQQWTL